MTKSRSTAALLKTDLHGVGPATVRHADVEHNKVTVTWQNRSLEVPLNSIRRAMIFATFHPDTPYGDDGGGAYGTSAIGMYAVRYQDHPAIQLVRDALDSIHTRSMLLGWVRHYDVWFTTKETRTHWDVLVSLIFIAQNFVKMPHVLTIRLASGVNTIPEAPQGVVSMLTLYYSTGRPHRIYSHISRFLDFSDLRLAGRGEDGAAGLRYAPSIPC